MKTLKKTCEIAINGCDDSTVFEMELSESEFETIKKLADKSKETSTYGCQPVIEIESK